MEDVAGNKTTKEGSLIVDKTINTYVTLTDASNSSAPGVGGMDNITNKSDITIGFNRGGSKTDKDLTATVRITGPDGYERVYEGIKTADGGFTLPEGLPTDGTYNFAWTFTDAAGNVSTQSNSVVLDTQVEQIKIEDLLFNGEPFVSGDDLMVKDDIISLELNKGENNEYVKVQIQVNGETYEGT